MKGGARNRGPNIVYRPGEFRALLRRMLPWYAAAFFAVIAAGSIIQGFWLSAALAMPLAALCPPAVRRLLRFPAWFPLHGRGGIPVASIAAVMALAGLCELELTRRVAEFDGNTAQILAQARQAVDDGNYEAIYALAKRYDVVPERPLEAFATEARTLEREKQERIEQLTDVFLEQYRRQRDARREAETESSQTGEQ